MNRKTNQDELRAKHYLQTLPHSKLEYEPLGNVTPDFVIDDSIAVEVRRLNRNYVENEHLVSVEDFDTPIKDSIKKDNFSWVLHELYKNIQLVIDEKNEKINKNFSLYDEWWLLLVDNITYGIEDKYFQELKKMKLQKYKFTKVIIISPEGDFEALEF